jgi:molecular chaperone GrpE (heat shock protein)
MWLASHLEQLRRGNEARFRAVLLSLVDVAEAVERFCQDPSAGALPPGWQEGLAVLRAKVLQALADHAVTPILTVGERLDPRCHHVIGVCDGPGEPGTVVRQLRPGYMWKDQVLQPAEVITVAGAST